VALTTADTDTNTKHKAKTLISLRKLNSTQLNFIDNIAVQRLD